MEAGLPRRRAGSFAEIGIKLILLYMLRTVSVNGPTKLKILK